jgi:hypothetical protein
VATGTTAFVITKLVGLRRRFAVRKARSFTARALPQLDAAYRAFASRQQSGSSRQPFKGYDLWRILEAAKPRSIVELGSGTTSAVFSLWAARHGAAFVAFEHDEGWARVTETCLREAGLDGAGAAIVRHVPWRVRDDKAATGFTEALPRDVDFIYVDGPPCTLAAGVKVPNDDVTRLLDDGGAPRTIVVDGRIDTVDLIRAHRESARYRFLPSLVYALRRSLWWDALHGREHSVLVRR